MTRPRIGLENPGEAAAQLPSSSAVEAPTGAQSTQVGSQPASTAVGTLPEVTPDGRQSAAARDIQRGVGRLLRTLDMAPLYEMPLANGRRADVVGLDATGNIWIVEIKSCLIDFRSDTKWPEYRDYCDRLLFAVAPDFPVEVLPEDAGLVLADRYGGEIVRAAPEHKLAPARRRALLLSFARLAAMRLASAIDRDPEVFSRVAG